MKKAILVTAAAGLGALSMTAGPAVAAPASLPNTQKTGSQLVNRFMSHLAKDEVGKLNAMLARSFIVQRANGSWEPKPAYLAQLPQVESYVITSSFSAYSSGALTVRWEVATHETLPGVPVGTSAAPRLSTFAWTKAGFVMTSHANFNPPVK